MAALSCPSFCTSVKPWALGFSVSKFTEEATSNASSSLKKKIPSSLNQNGDTDLEKKSMRKAVDDDGGVKYQLDLIDGTGRELLFIANLMRKSIWNGDKRRFSYHSNVFRLRWSFQEYTCVGANDDDVVGCRQIVIAFCMLMLVSYLNFPHSKKIKKKKWLFKFYNMTLRCKTRNPIQ